MNILFLSIGKLDDLSLKALYPDLVRALAQNNNMYVVTCVEKRTGKETSLSEECGCHILRVKTGDITHTSLVKKAINMMLLEKLFINAIDKYFLDIKFDLIIYSTPPINFEKVVARIKKRDGAKAYLLLKDIFPQNAVDLQMFSKLSPIYGYYRMKERNLYKLSDYIGCMSQRNVDYVLEHNRFVSKENVEICPNSVEVTELPKEIKCNQDIMKKYNIPCEKVKFIYGGNLGKPQGIDFLIETIDTMKTNERAFFIIIGSGTEYYKLENYIRCNNPSNVRLIKELPRDDYQRIAEQCDIGLIFLDKRFTIPNIPSRILSYMQAAKPVLAITDRNTDLKNIIEEGKFGWWAPSGEIKVVEQCFEVALESENMYKSIGNNGRDYLIHNFTAKHSAEIILKHFGENL